MVTNQPVQFQPGMTTPMFEVACQRHCVLASGGIAGQVNAFVIIQNLFAVGEMENRNAASLTSQWALLRATSALPPALCQ